MNHTVDSAAFQRPYLIRVEPTPAHADLHRQLLAKPDKVHPIRGEEDLLSNRLGFEGFSKQCFAMVRETVDGTLDVLAAIYTHLSTADTNQSSTNFLLGRVDEILNAPARPLDLPENLATCYSISSFGDNGGKLLIADLWESFANNARNPVVSTLSPFRTFAEFIERTGRAMPDTDHAFRLAAAAHLKERINPVQKFHQGNGAYAATFHIAANVPGSLDAVQGLNVMVGYRYPRSREALEANREDFRSGKVPASSAIRELMAACP